MKTKKTEEEKTEFSTNGLYWRANQYRKYATNEDEIEKINMTEPFLAELDYMIQHGEIINININAKMRMGKSTTMLSLGQHIFKLLQKYGKRKKTEQFGIENIAHDQSEYSEKMRNPSTTFTIICIDEENESENTGQDVTIIKAQNEDFSNIHADRYVHTIHASPKSIADTNSDMLLYITGINEETRETIAKLYYRYWEGQVEYTQILGYVIIPVGHIIHNWIDTVRPIFYEKIQLEADLSKNINNPKKHKEIALKLQTINETIKEWQNKDWYIHYYMKKRKRLELLTKYKISKPRILKYAPVILTIITRFEKLIPYQTIVKREIIKNNVRLEMRKAGLPQSIVGESLTTDEVLGVLEAIKSRYIVNINMQKLKNKKEEGKISIDYYQKEYEKLQELDESIKNNVDLQVEEYQNMISLLEEYNKKET